MLMLKNPLFASLLATLFTWFVTALGSAVVFVSKPTKSFLDGSLGFAGGVMVAASFWSLIAPSIEIAEGNGFGSLSFIPSAIGIVLGALFVDQAERMFPVEALLHLQQDVIGKKTNIKNGNVENVDDDDTAFVMSKNEKKGGKSGRLGKVQPTLTKRRGHSSRLPSIDEEMIISGDNDDLTRREAAKDHQEVSILTWKRTLMLAIAVTIHNIPGICKSHVTFSPTISNKTHFIEPWNKLKRDLPLVWLSDRLGVHHLLPSQVLLDLPLVLPSRIFLKELLLVFHSIVVVYPR
eukprot:m.64319 g.64319  ORF g.64319 m.64319 type:complete len:292 (-) comp8110_c0_seq1:360-1235(-)